MNNLIAKHLIEFAEHTLRCLEDDKNWNADTFDRIAERAKSLGLAERDTETFFRRKFYRAGSNMWVRRVRPIARRPGIHS